MVYMNVLEVGTFVFVRSQIVLLDTNTSDGSDCVVSTSFRPSRTLFNVVCVYDNTTQLVCFRVGQFTTLG